MIDNATSASVLNAEIKNAGSRPLSAITLVGLDLTPLGTRVTRNFENGKDSLCALEPYIDGSAGGDL
ncbi:hypothetical protein [Caballeronia sp. NCTM1]|uniref:hypothetical protein n=1 Tax=Caballeronia sp. NCTM1 TaxID=2921753 RepID=UPI0020297650|nr:hypothetical protein [Caballeronia sp. NCTM1]